MGRATAGSNPASVSSTICSTRSPRHGGFDLDVACRGDLDVDAHHTVEDVGICLGRAFSEALGRQGRSSRVFGHSFVPMDEALARAAVDLSGRPFLVYNADMPDEMVGAYPTVMSPEFFRSLTDPRPSERTHRPDSRDKRAPRHRGDFQGCRPGAQTGLRA